MSRIKQRQPAGPPRKRLASEAEGSAFPSLPSTTGRRWRILKDRTELGRFGIQRHVASGNLAEVYLAYDQTRGHEVAIKVVNLGPDDRTAEDARSRIEIAIANKVVDFSHVLKTHEVHVVSWGGTHLLVLSMEYADGGTLRQWLQKHGHDVPTRRVQGLQYFHQLCLGLKAMHAVGLWHLDVKPENALFVQGEVKIADPAASAAIQPRADGAGNVGPAVPGTPQYMSPQQFAACGREDLDARADIYSLGAILYEILHPAGHPPHEGDYLLLRRLHTCAPAPVLPEATPDQARIVNRCLAKDPIARYRSVEELLDDLAGPAAPPAVPVDQHLQQAGQLWALAQSLATQQHLVEAMQTCGQILQECPDHRDAAALQRELEDRYRQAERIYQTIEQGISAMNLEEVVALLMEAVRIFPGHPGAIVGPIRMEARTRQYREAMEDGTRLAMGRQWEEALECFRRANEISAGAQPARRGMHLATEVLHQVTETRQQIDQAIETRQGDRALAMARDLDRYLDQIGQSLLPHTQGTGGD